MRRYDRNNRRRRLDERTHFDRNGFVVRNPFSNSPAHYGGRQVADPKWMNLTSLYETTTHKNTTPINAVYAEKPQLFQEVLYSEPFNVLIAKVNDNGANLDYYNEGQDAYAVFGVKRANGVRTQWRWIDGGIAGSGQIYIDESDYNELKTNFMEAVKRLNPKYLRNLGYAYSSEFETDRLGDAN